MSGEVSVFRGGGYGDLGEMSRYLKLYELYWEWKRKDERYREELCGLGYGLGDLEKKRFEEIKVEVNGRKGEIEKICEGYDFDGKVRGEVIGRYVEEVRVWCYGVLKDSILERKLGGKFRSKREYMNHIHIGVRVLKEHFIRGFYYEEGLGKIFEKVLEDLVEGFEVIVGGSVVLQEEGLEGGVEEGLRKE